jgi:hypothetical protein
LQTAPAADNPDRLSSNLSVSEESQRKGLVIVEKPRFVGERGLKEWLEKGNAFVKTLGSKKISPRRLSGKHEFPAPSTGEG